MRKEISNSDDVIDSRDVIERIEELEAERQELVDKLEEAQQNRDDFDPEEGGGDEAELGQWLYEAKKALAEWDASDEAEELKALQSLQNEAEGYSDDWRHGATLIRNSYFKDYAEQLADDIGAIDKNATWPLNCIDWDEAADELKQDYTSVDFDGVEYWVR